MNQTKRAKKQKTKKNPATIELGSKSNQAPALLPEENWNVVLTW